MNSKKRNFIVLYIFLFLGFQVSNAQYNTIYNFNASNEGANGFLTLDNGILYMGGE
jgi:hypothetical protein